MPRGRKPKPAVLKLLEGNRSKRPLGQEPQPSVMAAVPPPPRFLSADGREEWARVSVELYRLGLLTEVDCASLGAYCQTYGRWVAAERAIQAMAEQNPGTEGLVVPGTVQAYVANTLVGISARAARDMVRFAEQFGLTPAARARIAQGPVNPPKSKFAGLLGGVEP